MRRLRTSLVLALLAPLPLSAQATLTGDPIRVPFACAEDELQAAGLVCTEDEPCPIFLELSALATAGRKFLVAGDLHSASGTLSSILLESEDGGTNWKEPAPRARGSAIDFLEFYDFDHAWAAGESQTPLPRDPFFLVSTDGGQTWRNRPVTEEGGPGSVQRFWFDSAQHGELIVDAGKRAPSGRYLTYESETGGDTWMIRATGDQLPKIRRAPASFDNPDYRIRAAGAGKVYRIEKRIEEKGRDKWETVASFLIEVASCRIKPPELPDPAAAGHEVEESAEQPKDYVEELRVGDPPKPKPAPKKKKGQN